MPAPEPIPELLKAVNEASGKAFALWVTFLTVSIYLAITIGTTTHLQLLLAGPVKMPLLGVDLPLAAFYGFAPPLFVTLHLYVLVQLYLLAQLLRRFDSQLQSARMLELDRGTIRDQLDKFVFTQSLIGASQEKVIRQSLWAVVWLSLIAGPILLLFGFVFRFGPYFNLWITATHRSVVFLDLVLLAELWPKIDTHVQKLLVVKFWRRIFVCLTLVAYAAANIYYPLSGLVLENERLVEPDEAKLANLAVTLSLRGRSLLLGSFRGSDFRKADFSSADLRGSNFTDAKLAGAELRGADLKETILAGANLSCADLRGVSLWHADLTGTDLTDADLTDARNLTQGQLDAACGTDAKLRPGLTLKPCHRPR